MRSLASSGFTKHAGGLGLERRPRVSSAWRHTAHSSAPEDYFAEVVARSPAASALHSMGIIFSSDLASSSRPALKPTRCSGLSVAQPLLSGLRQQERTQRGPRDLVKICSPSQLLDRVRRARAKGALSGSHENARWHAPSDRRGERHILRCSSAGKRGSMRRARRWLSWAVGAEGANGGLSLPQETETETPPETDKKRPGCRAVAHGR